VQLTVVGNGQRSERARESFDHCHPGIDDDLGREVTKIAPILKEGYIIHETEVLRGRLERT
jgi:hypothetical protein